MPKSSSKNKKSKAPVYISHSQRNKVGKQSLKFGSARTTVLMAVMVLGSAFAGLGILQQSKESKAAVTEPIVLQDSQCTRTIDPTNTFEVSNGEILCLNPGTYNITGGLITMYTNNATVTTTPSKLSTGGKARILGKFTIYGDDNRILNLFIDGLGDNSGTILTPNGTDNTIIQGNDITSTAQNKTSTSQNDRQGVCLNIGTGGTSTAAVGPKNTLIDRNKIFNCGWGKFDQAIYLSNNQFARVTNNIVFDNPMFGLQFYPDSHGAVVENNLFDRNAAGITFSGSSTTQYSRDNIFRNNIVSNTGHNQYGNAITAAASERSIGHWWDGTVGTGNQANDNCVINGRYGLYKSGTNPGYTKSGNIDIPTGDPLYTNAVPGGDALTKDFTLLPASPCIGKGPVAAVPPTPTTDTIAPTVNITTPNEGSLVTDVISIAANATDNIGVVGVQFKINNVNLGTEITASPYQISWDTLPLANGPYVITAVARDASGNSSTSTAVNVSINNAPIPPSDIDVEPPSVQITAPSTNTTVSGSSVSITANATDNISVSGVQFKLNGNNLGVEDTTAPYGTTWNTTSVANGSYSITAVARDEAGNVSTSNQVTVSVNNPVPETVLSTIEAQNATSCRFNWSSTRCSSSVTSLSGVGAVNNNFVVLSSNNNSITQNFNTPTDGTYKFGFVARSKSYRGDAKVDVFLNNVKVSTGFTLSPSAFTFYTLTQNLPAGSHSIRFVYINDKCGNTVPRESCNTTNDRNAWIDQFRLVRL